MKIKQVSVAPFLNYFKRGLKERWGLTDYHNLDEPCLFFGMEQQINLINKHKGYKLLYPSHGGDKFLPSIKKENVICFYRAYAEIPFDVPSKKGWIETRVNDELKCIPKGDKVIVYYRSPQEAKGMGLEYVEKLQKLIDFKIVGIAHNPPIPFNQIINKYYNQAFVGINFTTTAGLTTVCDLGLMGIKTIMNTKEELNSLIKFQSFEEIPSIIQEESKNIGIQGSIINNYTLNDVWQDLDFWLN